MTIESMYDLPVTAKMECIKEEGYELVIHTLDDKTIYVSTWGPEVFSGPYGPEVGENQAIQHHLDIINGRVEQ